MTRAIQEKKRIELIAMYKNNNPIRKISKKLGIEPKTVRNYVKKFDSTGSVKEKKRSGRPPKLTVKQKVRVALISKRNCKLSAPKIAAEMNKTLKTPISAQTVRNVLASKGIFARRIAMKPNITSKARQARLNWCRTMSNWTLAEWQQVYFSDESKFNLDGSDGINYVYRKNGQRYKDRFVQGIRKFGGGSIMVWGVISYNGYRRICRILGKMDSNVYLSILKDHVSLPPHSIIYQDDNDPKHTAKQVKKWEESVNLDRLPWPSSSPDLNIIENVWWEIEKQLYAGDKTTGSYTTESLWNAVETIFYNLDQNYIIKLYESLPSRIEAIIEAKGGHTKY
jgi:transposase